MPSRPKLIDRYKPRNQKCRPGTKNQYPFRRILRRCLLPHWDPLRLGEGSIIPMRLSRLLKSRIRTLPRHQREMERDLHYLYHGVEHDHEHCSLHSTVCICDDCDYTYTLLMKLDNDNSAYSSSGGRSSSLYYQYQHYVTPTLTHPSSILDADAGPVLSFFFCGSPSAETLNKSRTSPVFIDPNPEFCCVTTDEAIFILNLCRLSSLVPAHPLCRYDPPHNLLLQCSSRDEPVHIDHLPLT